jgi:hypothetical protein
MISLNAESCVVVAGVLVALWRGTARKPRPAWSVERLDLVLWIALTLTVVLAFGWMAGTYFLSDDFILLKHARNSAWTWRGVFTTAGGDGFFRPLGDMSYVLSTRAADSNAVVWHSIGFALHAVNAVLLYALAMSIGYSRLAAWLAATVFALHAAHPEAVVWMAGRFDLLAAFFVLAGLIAFRRYLKREASAWGWLAIAAMAMIAGLLSKECAYVFPLLAALMVACLNSTRRSRAWGAVLGFALITAAMFVYRWRIQGGIGGYGSVSVIGSAKALLFRMWAILFFPVNRALPISAWWFVVLTAGYAAALIVLFLSRAELAKLAFALGLAILTAAPAVSQLAIGPDLEKSRVLYLPSAGFCLLIGALTASARVRSVIAATLIVFQAAALWHNLTGWRRASEITESVCKAAAECSDRTGEIPAVEGLPRTWHGVYTFWNGFAECVEMNRRTDAVPNRGSARCQFRFDGGSGAIEPVQ